MTNIADLRHHYAAFESVQRAITANTPASNPDWKLRLINLRRDLQIELGNIREALKKCEAGGADSDACRTFANELSKLRSAIALHQASWPTVVIDLDNPDYKASQRKLREASQQFHKVSTGLISRILA